MGDLKAEPPNLMSIPAELREMILKYLLCTTDLLEDTPDILNDTLFEQFCIAEEDEIDIDDDDDEIGSNDENDSDSEPDEANNSHEIKNENDESHGEARSDHAIEAVQLPNIETESKDEQLSTNDSNSVSDLDSDNEHTELKAMSEKDQISVSAEANKKPEMEHGREKTASTSNLPKKPFIFDEFKSHKRFSLHPAILRTCRQLYNEGLALLHKNKLKMNVTYYLTYKPGVLPRSYIVGESSVAAALTKYPFLTHIKSWNITSYIDTEDDEDDCYTYLTDLTQQMKADIRAIQKLGKLNRIHIGAYSVNYHTSDQIPVLHEMRLMNPWRSIRAEECIAEVGVMMYPDKDGIILRDSKMCTQIEEEVRSDWPILILEYMGKSLLTSCSRLTSLVYSGVYQTNAILMGANSIEWHQCDEEMHGVEGDCECCSNPLSLPCMQPAHIDELQSHLTSLSRSEMVYDIDQARHSLWHVVTVLQDYFTNTGRAVRDGIQAVASQPRKFRNRREMIKEFRTQLALMNSYSQQLKDMHQEFQLFTHDEYHAAGGAHRFLNSW